MFFTSDRVVRGDPRPASTTPEWEPLLELAPDHIDDFMWMFEVELESGLRLHAYKHVETRKYLHLDKEGRAFVYLWSDQEVPEEDPGYREVDPQCMLKEVLRPEGESMPSISTVLRHHDPDVLQRGFPSRQATFSR